MPEKNKQLTRPAAALHPIPVVGPWHHVGIDMIDPLPCTISGNAYIITCWDYFTKWPEAVAVPDKFAHFVAMFLITRHV